MNSSSSYYEKCAEQTLGKSVIQNGMPTDQSSQPSQHRQDQATDWCDLAAQQSMAESTFAAARSAYWAALLTGFGILLIGLTLFFTKRTLDETKRGVDVTRITGEAQVRAFIVMKAELHNSPLYNVPVVIFVHIENVGNSPATKCAVEGVAAFYKREASIQSDDIRPVQIKNFESGILQHGTSRILELKTPNPMTDDLRESVQNNGRIAVKFGVTCSYLDIFKHSHRTSVRGEMILETTQHDDESNNSVGFTNVGVRWETTEFE